jgi:hypothetical protein
MNPDTLTKVAAGSLLAQLINFQQANTIDADEWRKLLLNVVLVACAAVGPSILKFVRAWFDSKTRDLEP